MALWDKLKTELDRAGRAAQTAIDEGKVRLDVMRVRQLADKTAETLGYAVFNARRNGHELDAETYARLSSTLAAHQAEVDRLESQLARAAEARARHPGASEAQAPAADAAAGVPADASAPEATTAPAPAAPTTSVDPAMGDNPDRPAPPAF